jgi:hypothetical protein
MIGFVGADLEQRQARNNNGSKFTVLSVATQWSWKNTDAECPPGPLLVACEDCQLCYLRHTQMLPSEGD